MGSAFGQMHLGNRHIFANCKLREMKWTNESLFSQSRTTNLSLSFCYSRFRDNEFLRVVTVAVTEAKDTNWNVMLQRLLQVT